MNKNIAKNILMLLLLFFNLYYFIMWKNCESEKQEILNRPNIIEPQTITMFRTVYVDPPEPEIKITSVEREMIARLLYTEARGEPIECQYAIVSVIFNRCDSTGSSVEKVIYKENQFDLASTLYRITPTEKEYEAVDYVLQNGKTVPNWVQYFRSSRHHDWSNNYVGYCVIGNTYFGGIKNP